MPESFTGYVEPPEDGWILNGDLDVEGTISSNGVPITPGGSVPDPTDAPDGQVIETASGAYVLVTPAAGGVVGGVTLASDSAVPAASGTSLDWGNGANPFDATPQYRDGSGNPTDTPVTWLVGGPTTYRLAGGVYVMQYHIVTSVANTDATILQITPNVRTAAGNFAGQYPIVTANVNPSFFLTNTVMVEAHGGPGSIGVITVEIGAFLDGENLGDQDYSIELTVWKLA